MDGGGPLPTTMTWFLNEQGRPVSLPPKVPPPNCAGNILSSGAGSTTESNAAAIPFVIFGFADTVNGKTGIQRLMVDPCRSHVYINATLNGGGDRGVQNITIHISDSDLDTRAAVATQTYLDNAAAAQQQQELNKEKQQAAPKL